MVPFFGDMLIFGGEKSFNSGILSFIYSIIPCVVRPYLHSGRSGIGGPRKFTHFSDPKKNGPGRKRKFHLNQPSFFSGYVYIYILILVFVGVFPIFPKKNDVNSFEK